MSSYITPEQQQAIAAEEERLKKNGLNKADLNAYIYDYLQAHPYIIGIAEQNPESRLWTVNNEGTYKIVTNGKGKTETVIATTTPIIPERAFKNQNSGIEQIKIAFLHRNKWQSILVNRESVSTKSQILKLSNHGIAVTDENARTLIKYFDEILALNKTNAEFYGTASESMGWCTDDDSNELCFVPYAGNIQFASEEQFGSVYKHYHSKGTLKAWTEFMQPLRKNTIFRLGMAAAFASPLIELVSANPFIYHLWGRTEIGKTVLLMSAMSIWGNPERGKLTRSLNGTLNSMLATATFLHSLPFAGDELQTMKRYFKNYDDMIYCLTEGIDRSRMNAQAEVKETKSWMCSFIFTGEEPIIKADSAAGAVNRVIECCTDNKIINNGRDAANFVKKNYGTAGSEYIKKLLELNSSGELEKLYVSFENAVINMYSDHTDKQLQIMALLLTADEIARQMFWHDEACLDSDLIAPFLKTKSEVDFAERAYEYIKSIISIHTDNFEGAGRECWGSIDKATGEVLFNQHELSAQLSNMGFDFNAIKKSWADKEYIARFTQNGKKRYAYSKNGVAYVKFLHREENEPTLEEVTDPVPEEIS